MGRRRFAGPFLAAALAATFVATPPTAVEAQATETSSSPVLYVSPGCFDGDETSITVSGRNFEPGRPVEVWDLYNTTDLAYGTYVSATPNDYGNFTANLTFEYFTGYHRITTDYADDSGFDPLGTLIVAHCEPKLLPVPKCADASLPAIEVSGKGFVPYGTSYDDIVITIRDQNQAVVGSRRIGPTLVFNNISVNLTSSLYPYGVPEGTYVIEVTQGTDTEDENYRHAESGFLLPCPTVTVEPECGPRGAPPDTMTLTVTTTGFPSGQVSMEIVFDPDGEPQEFWGYGGDGTFTITPYRRPDGEYTIVAKQGYFAGQVYSGLYYAVYPADTHRRLTEATTTFKVTCDEPTLIPPVTAPTATITADPACGPPQLQNDVPVTTIVTVTGAGFYSGTVALTLDPGGLNEQQFSASADANGDFVAALPIRAGPVGEYKILAQQQYAADASATFSVPCLPPLPLLVADPPCGEPMAGVPLAYVVTLTGSGFLPGRVDLTFDATGLLPETLPPAIADANGSFTTFVTPSGRGPAVYQILAHQQVAGSEEVVDGYTTFTVACGPPAWELLPANGSRGFVVTVTGHYFPYDADLLLRWDRGIGAGIGIPARTDANGVFTRQILIFHSDFTGLRRLSIELATDPLALTTVLPLDFDVRMGSVSPPFALTDNPYAQPDSSIQLRR